MIKQYQESEEMRSNSLDSKLKAKEVELKRHEQEIADQDEVRYMCLSCLQNTSIPKKYFFYKKYCTSYSSFG